jgi:hypothetical protein
VSAPSGIVFAATVVVSSPILWLVHEGSLSIEDAVLRWFVCLAVCRIAISVVSSVAFPDPRLAVPPRVEGAGAPGEPVTAGVE